MSMFGPAFKKIVEVQQAAVRIFEVMDREPMIRNPENGVKIANLKGEIKFYNVTFAYPKEKDRKIIRNLHLELSINKNGLAGESGCGKSTIMQLIMRFYDPDHPRQSRPQNFELGVAQIADRLRRPGAGSVRDFHSGEPAVWQRPSHR